MADFYVSLQSSQNEFNYKSEKERKTDRQTEKKSLAELAILKGWHLACPAVRIKHGTQTVPTYAVGWRCMWQFREGALGEGVDDRRSSRHVLECCEPCSVISEPNILIPIAVLDAAICIGE